MTTIPKLSQPGIPPTVSFRTERSEGGISSLPKLNSRLLAGIHDHLKRNSSSAAIAASFGMTLYFVKHLKSAPNSTADGTIVL
jgi:hypothetical protein